MHTNDRKKKAKKKSEKLIWFVIKPAPIWHPTPCRVSPMSILHDQDVKFLVSEKRRAFSEISIKIFLRVMDGSLIKKD